MSVSLINRPHFFAQKKQATEAPAPQFDVSAELLIKKVSLLQNQLETKNSLQLKQGTEQSKRLALLDENKNVRPFNTEKQASSIIAKAGFFSVPKPPTPEGNVLDFLAPKPRQ